MLLLKVISFTPESTQKIAWAEEPRHLADPDIIAQEGSVPTVAVKQSHTEETDVDRISSSIQIVAEEPGHKYIDQQPRSRTTPSSAALCAACCLEGTKKTSEHIGGGLVLGIAGTLTCGLWLAGEAAISALQCIPATFCKVKFDANGDHCGLNRHGWALLGKAWNVLTCKDNTGLCDYEVDPADDAQTIARNTLNRDRKQHKSDVQKFNRDANDGKEFDDSAGYNPRRDELKKEEKDLTKREKALA